MSKSITYIITFLVIFIVLPIGAYTFYCDYQDGLYPTLVEYDSYTTKDKDFDVKVMKFNGLSGEEVYNFKLFLVNKKTNEAIFIKTVKISSYGTAIEYEEDKSLIDRYNVKVTFTATGGKIEVVEVDTVNGRVFGKKLRGGFLI